ncbi:phosphatase PAP2 family protein [Hymenobacter sp. RP-2-7]|uniref:Phosphatase PAP2 family protein n=1 Tax=Hymenobacter polaris TaxID=2682546 RepID=A0A7Y0ACH2_9BACT|nr:phosphatase PAP2 family protein [Hymenobacter polaris]NML64819.1 phosphatase PAP2 family protein [Hymenobacter polaris]
MVIRSFTGLRTALLASTWLLAGPALAQQPARPDSVAAVPAAPDTTRHKYQTPPAAPRPPWYRGKLVRATVVPAALIGYGLSVYDDRGFYSSQQARADIQRHFPNFSNHLDDYLQYAPYLELGAVLAFGVEGRNDRLNLALILVKSELLMAGAVEITKRATHQLRPDGSDYRSFPSGHTAQAFLAASIVHTELRHKSQWYGVGAYTLATTVGAFRMLNNKHWEADVFAGAGYGILAAHLAYLSHRHRWGRRPPQRPGVGQQPPRPPQWQLRWAPVPLPGGLGLQLSWHPTP